MAKKLTDHQKEVLREYEPVLERSRRTGDLVSAEKAILTIQAQFLEQRSHFRLLNAKLYYYEVLLDAGKTEDAMKGFESVYLRAGKGTRIYLEASSFLGICALRLKKLDEAKKHIRYVVNNTKHIDSVERRQQFYKRFIDRLEEECVLSQLIGEERGSMDTDEIHLHAIELVKKSDSELLENIARSLPHQTKAIVSEVRSYSINLVPLTDRKLLPPPRPEIPDSELGRKALAALKRIGWRSFCDKESGLYKLWKDRAPKIFNQGYFASSIVTTLAEWRIGLPQLAAGIVATAMRFGCAEFCTQFKPDGLMIPRSEKPRKAA
jgi:hypothetical protein